MTTEPCASVVRFTGSLEGGLMNINILLLIIILRLLILNIIMQMAFENLRYRTRLSTSLKCPKFPKISLPRDVARRCICHQQLSRQQHHGLSECCWVLFHLSIKNILVWILLMVEIQPNHYITTSSLSHYSQVLI